MVVQQQRVKLLLMVRVTNQTQYFDHSSPLRCTLTTEWIVTFVKIHHQGLACALSVYFPADTEDSKQHCGMLSWFRPEMPVSLI